MESKRKTKYSHLRIWYRQFVLINSPVEIQWRLWTIWWVKSASLLNFQSCCEQIQRIKTLRWPLQIPQNAMVWESIGMTSSVVRTTLTIGRPYRLKNWSKSHTLTDPKRTPITNLNNNFPINSCILKFPFEWTRQMKINAFDARLVALAIDGLAAHTHRVAKSQKKDLLLWRLQSNNWYSLLTISDLNFKNEDLLKTVRKLVENASSPSLDCPTHIIIYPSIYREKKMRAKQRLRSENIVSISLCSLWAIAAINPY